MTGATESSGPRLSQERMLAAAQPPSFTSVFARTRFVGLHQWPSAPPAVAWLRNRHRHEFHIEVELPVGHDDRAIEFQLLKQLVDDMLAAWYQPVGAEQAAHLGTTSCETIGHRLALALLDEFTDAAWCQVTVSEDGENGSRVFEARL